MWGGFFSSRGEDIGATYSSPNNIFERFSCKENCEWSSCIVDRHIDEMNDLVAAGPGSHGPISIELEDSELWKRFHHQTNEMIVTKGGRRMFPLIKVKIKGLEPRAFYSILLEFKQIENNRWKYINGEWLAGGKSEPPPQGALYTHPDSPNYGSHWSKDPVSFQRVKLTNKVCTKGKIMLNSLHKYEPRIHVIKVDQGGVNNGQQLVQTFAFPSTQFIAVTAYQNEDVTALKIRHNPFAKAFQQDAAQNSSSIGSRQQTPQPASTLRQAPYKIPQRNYIQRQYKEEPVPQHQVQQQQWPPMVPEYPHPSPMASYGAAVWGNGWGMGDHDQMIFHHPEYFNIYNRSAAVQPSPASSSSSATMSPASTSLGASSPQISPAPVTSAPTDFERVKPENSSPTPPQQQQHQQPGHQPDQLPSAAMYHLDNELPSNFGAFEPWDPMGSPSSLMFGNQ